MAIRLSRYSRSSRNFTCETASLKFPLVAEITRTSTDRVSLEPSCSKVRSCRTRSIFTWQEGSRSPISSRNMVPPFAISNLPLRSCRASVNAPLRSPNISLSNRVEEIPPMFTLMNGPSLRWLLRWMASAMSSLPVPLSPVIRTDASVALTLPAISSVDTSLGSLPIITEKSYRVSSSSRLRVLRGAPGAVHGFWHQPETPKTMVKANSRKR